MVITTCTRLMVAAFNNGVKPSASRWLADIVSVRGNAVLPPVICRSREVSAFTIISTISTWSVLAAWCKAVSLLLSDFLISSGCFSSSSRTIFSANTSHKRPERSSYASSVENG